MVSKSHQTSEFSQPSARRAFSVFLVMDNRAARESFAGFLRGQKLDVRDYMTAMEFYRDYQEPQPGVLITELQLRGMTGVELFEKLTADQHDLPVAFISGHADAPAAVRLVQQGAIDFILKPVREDSLLQLVARAYAFYYDVDWEFVGEDMHKVESGMNRLTDREKEVIDQIVGGHSSREAAAALGVSTKTIEAHRARISDKLRCDDLAHMIRMIMTWKQAHEQ